jgi:hypothetical protein
MLRAFFWFLHSMWEFLSVINQALIFNTIIGIIAVTFIALIVIPHWSAAFITFPMICILYVDLLGALQWAGKFIKLIVGLLFLPNPTIRTHPWHVRTLFRCSCQRGLVRYSW